MEYLNKVEIVGVVGNVRVQTYDDSRMARMSVATNRAYKSRDGQAVIDTDWHQVIVWEGRNITGLDRLERGSKVHVFGRLRYQKYTGHDGIERTAVEILANKVEILGVKTLSVEGADNI